MEIPCRAIAEELTRQLKLEVARFDKKIKILDFVAGSSSQQQSYIKIKKRKADEIGIDFIPVDYSDKINTCDLIELIMKQIAENRPQGVIVQLPLAKHLDVDLVYKQIPAHLEVEGHTDGSRFFYPLGLAVLTGIKYTICNDVKNSIIDLEKDSKILLNFTEQKRVILLGYGVTAGRPIARTLARLNIPFVNIRSNNFIESRGLIKQADIIITAVGKPILIQDMIKPGVILLNVGLSKVDGKLRGDYDEANIAKRAGYYTSTPGGLGPIDVLYLYKNLIEAAKNETIALTSNP